MAFPYKTIAVFGATSGIGLALTERFLAANIFVIAIGRRKERLEELVAKHGSDKVQAATFDITELDAIPAFTSWLTSNHPDLDLVFLNSGVQFGHKFNKPEGVNLNVIRDEFNTNYFAHVHLTKAFLPFLLARAKEGKPVGLMYTTSALALVPQHLVPNYSATKAAMHAFILCIREQLKGTGVKVLELFPPAVQTEIHGKSGGSFGMPLEEYTDAVSTSTLRRLSGVLC
jgi:short-subunit dehydrogenase involved in D-alanine esterification of teichoic acids